MESRRASFIILLSATFIFPACLETTVSTVVHPDGRLTRTMTFSADSGLIARREFPLPLDSTWKIAVHRKDSATFVLNAEQTFENDAAMNRALIGIPGKTLTVSAVLSERFRWFMTYYEYVETWKCYRHADAIPMSEYLSNEDLDLLYEKAMLKKTPVSADDSTRLETLEKRFNEWRIKNLFESYFVEFKRGIGMIEKPRITLAEVDQKRSRLWDSVFKNELEAKDGTKKAKNLTPQQQFSLVMDPKGVAEIFRANAKGFDSLDALDKYEGIGGAKVKRVSVTMPGLLVSTNAEALEGSSGTWKEVLDMQYFRDVELRSESRIVNWWAVIVTGIVLAALVLYVVIALLRKRRSAMTPVG